MEGDGVPENSTSYMQMLWGAIAYSGWYILGIAVALFFATPYFHEKYKSWKHRKDEAEYAAKYHKNPDLMEERLRGIEQARQKMQEKYNKSAATALELEEERKEAKRLEVAELMNKKSSGRRLGTADESRPSTSNLNNEYNPLMGDSSRGYKAPKRSCCGKGGCG